MTESAIAAPPQLDTFRVVYRAGVQRPDDSDTGSEPNWFAQGGPVTISCSAEKLVVTEADGRRRVVWLPEGPFTIRATDGELVDQQGVVGVTLLDTTTPSVSPQGAT